MADEERTPLREQYALLKKSDSGRRCSTRFGPSVNTAVLLVVVTLLVCLRVGRDAVVSRDLTFACVALFLIVMVGLYVFSARRLPGALGGLTPSDYRVSAAMDFTPATELALVGFSVSADLLPVIEWTRASTDLVAARVGLAAATAACFVAIAGTPFHAFPESHDLWSVVTFLMILGYAGAVASALGDAVLWSLWASLVVVFVLTLGALGALLGHGLPSPSRANTAFALLSIAEHCFIATLASFLIVAAYR